MSGRKWSGPRASFNPAGWISWIVGFVVGAFNLVVPVIVHWSWANKAFLHLAEYKGFIPVPPVTALAVGFAIYVVLSVVGARTRRLLAPGGKAVQGDARGSLQLDASGGSPRVVWPAGLFRSNADYSETSFRAA